MRADQNGGDAVPGATGLSSWKRVLDILGIRLKQSRFHVNQNPGGVHSADLNSRCRCAFCFIWTNGMLNRQRSS